MGCINARSTREKDENKRYIDVQLHDERKVGFGLSVHKSDKKMGIEVCTTGKITHDKDKKYFDHIDTKEIEEENKNETE